MARFCDACDEGNETLATQLYAQIETDLLVSSRSGLDDPREPINQFSMGNKRLTLIQQRLWQLRHPELGEAGHY